MKRVFILFVIFISFARLSAPAQDATSAAAIAARQDADERYKRMAADLQAVQADNEAMHAKISALEQTIQGLRDAQAKPVDNSAIQDQLKRLAEKIQEVDKKRIEDKQTIADEVHASIGGLQKSLGETPPPIHTPKPKPAAAPETPIAENGFTYTIQDGNTFGEILQAYNKDFKAKGLKPISMKQLREANPNVDPARLRVGQKIIVPRPAGA